MNVLESVVDYRLVVTFVKESRFFLYTYLFELLVWRSSIVERC